ncbi:hypothetical protein GIB67_017957 [Kingdonia uniflora]|uniref:Carboxypeptidase n=1 Tax=Kingdonia uniflora TaxID=39325 RepID=A0A7J7MI20_9MAGN|nr:hypothetical protein GIB67_017957 [Kingdonia uniflora]
MFYFFFESQTKEDPMGIWLTGGPGCSSELAVLYENGPFNIAKNLFLASNLLYVDQPTGTGFSYSCDNRDLLHNKDGVSNDLYDILQAFFTEHPQYVRNDFYITGESYVGHYIPAFSTRVHRDNKAKESIHINLKGFAIGNRLTDPAIHYKAYSDYALEMAIIQQSHYKNVNKMLPAYELVIKLCGTHGTTASMASYVVCNSVFNKIMSFAGEKTSALGVGEIEFVSCSLTVYQSMLMNWMRNLKVGIPALLEDGEKLLTYAGEYDLICN